MGAGGSRGRCPAVNRIPHTPAGTGNTESPRRFTPLVCAVSLASILALVPLIITPGLFLYYDVTPKALALLISSAVLIFYSAGSLRSLWSRPPGRRVVIAVSLMAASLLLSTLLSDSPAHALSGSNWRRFGLPVQFSLLLFLLVSADRLSRDRSFRTLLLRVAVVAGVCTGLYALCQYLELDPLIQRQLYSVGQFNQPILRPPSSAGSAPAFGNFSLMVVFLAVAVWQSDRSVLWRRLAAAAAVLSSIGVLLSGTRSAWLGLVVGGLLLTGGRLRAIPRQTVRALLVAVVLLVGFAVSPPGRYFRNRVVQAWGDWKGGTRTWVWRDSFAMFAHHPLFGYGPDTFAGYYPRFQSAEAAVAYPDSYNESPHNLLLDALTGQGALGLFALTLLLAPALLLAWRACRAATPAAAAGAGVVAMFLAHQFFVLELTTAVYFFFGIALLLSDAIPPPEATAQTRAAVGIRFALLPAAVLLACFAVQLGWADLRLARAKTHLDRKLLADAVSDYQAARRFAPPGYNSSLWFSRSLLDAARAANQLPTFLPAISDAARDASENAEDRHNACMHQAMLQAAGGNPSQALLSIHQARSLAPVWYVPYWAEASLLFTQRQYAQAAVFAGQAVALSGKHRPEVNQLQEMIRNAQQGQTK